MKKLFGLLLFLSIFFIRNSFIYAQQSGSFSLSATTTETTINIVLKGPTSSSITARPLVSETAINEITDSITYGLEQVRLNPSGTTQWTTFGDNIKPGTTYYIRVFDVETKKFLVENISITTKNKEIFVEPINIKDLGSNIFAVNGSVMVSKHKETDPVPLSSISVSVEIYNQISKEKIYSVSGGKLKKDSDGAFTIPIDTRSLNSNTNYDLIVVFTSDNGAKVEKKTVFNSKTGIVVPPTQKDLENEFNRKSYRLLAPIPGMVALLDPDLCQQRKTSNPGEICDINAFLNFLLSLIIGLAAVVLVVRLIITGFGYMTTDIPFKKAKMKGDFREALIGLVVALSSYLILNTINPRLVNNDIAIETADFSVENFGDIDSNFVPPVGGGADFDPSNFPSGVLCPEAGGRSSIRSIAGSWEGKATYKQIGRGTKGPNNTYNIDCSAYVATVLECAGIQPPQKASAATTYSFFVQMPGSEKVSSSDFSQVGDKVFVKGKELLPGDLVGWRGVGKNGPMGHVVIYVGGGMFREAQVGGYHIGNSVQKEKTLKYEMNAMNGSNVTQGYIRRI